MSMPHGDVNDPEEFDKVIKSIEKGFTKKPDVIRNNDESSIMKEILAECRDISSKTERVKNNVIFLFWIVIASVAANIILAIISFA